MVPDLQTIVEDYLRDSQVVDSTRSTDPDKLDPARAMVRRLLMQSESQPRRGFFYAIYRNLTDFHPHKWMYDSRSLIRLMEEAGFTECRSRECHDSEIPLIDKVESTERAEAQSSWKASRSKRTGPITLRPPVSGSIEVCSMSYALSSDSWEIPPSAEEHLIPPVDSTAQVRRSLMIPILFLVPLALSAVSYAAGSLMVLTDLAFLILCAICAVLLVVELANFSQRTGIGGVLLYGGVLIWFCHDYLTHWFDHDFTLPNPAYPGVTPAVVVRAFFYHALFIEMMAIGIRFRFGRWADRLIVAVPEPSDSRFYLGLLVVMLLFGWSAFFAASAPIYYAIPQGALWFLMGPIKFDVWRTGNINYNWGGYVAQIIQVGQISGILGAFYALLISKKLAGKIFGWLIWLYWFMYSVAGTRRGEIAFMGLPVIALVFLKYHSLGSAEQQKQKVRAWVFTGVLCLSAWYAVALETAQRIGDAPVEMLEANGNTMFSEGLVAWNIIPEVRDFQYDIFPGSTIILPMPATAFWLVTGPVPRALWTTKPIESFELWYNSYISGDKRSEESGGLAGTTISNGAVGYWYFRYGPWGVVEGGLLYGWLLAITERALRRAGSQPMKLLFALSFATFMFRSYRDLWWHNLDPLIVGGVVLTIVIKLFFSSPRESHVALTQTA